MTWTEPGFEAVARLLGTRTGLTFAAGRRAGAEMGIRRAMARAGIAHPARYCERIAVDKGLLDDLIIELTVGETYFFRESAHFQLIRGVVLPEIRQRRGVGHVFRAWSAGCASGEEAYTLAMLFDEEGLAGQTHLLATDISRGALQKAIRATYGNWSLRGEAAEEARSYLHRQGDRFVVHEKIKRLVTFEYLNLALDVYPSFANGTWGMDLILCRNVLIYFDPETIRGVARRFYASLADGGWLITASSDPPLSDEAPFETVVTDQGVFYRRRTLTLVASGALPAIRAAEPTPPRPDPARPEPSTSTAPAPAPVGVLVDGVATPDQDRATILAAARDDLAHGEYDRAAGRTCDHGDDPVVGAMHVRALANIDAHRAERACAEAIARHPFAGELHYLRAVLLLGLGRDAEAARSARRVIYLDRTLALAHFLLGSILRRRGDRAGARRAYRNARDLCAARPPDEDVPLSDGEPAAALAEAAKAQLAQLDSGPEEPR